MSKNTTSTTSSPATMGATRRLGRFISELRFEQLPQPVVAEAVRASINLLGCSINGALHESVGMVLAGLGPFGGPPQATVPGLARRADCLLTALASGIASHVGDFDDTHPDILLHPSGPVISALLPLAEMRGASGADFITAFVAGVEVECRVARAVYPAHYDAGWHITGTAGIFGAAAACARLLGLDETRSAWALGIAATQSAGIREMFGSMCKSLHVGRAAQGGLTAALLAQQGYTSADAAIEGKRGFIHVLSSVAHPEALTAGLNTEWELLRNTYKPYACGLVIHPALDGCIQLRNQHKLTAADIARIELQVHPLALELTGKPSPRSGLEGKFSVFHAAAVGIIDGAGGEQQFSDARVRSADAIALRGKVTARVEPGVGMEQAVVTAYTTGGQRHEVRIKHCAGSLERPLSDAELDAKFLELAKPAIGARAAAALAALRGLPVAGNCADLAALCGAVA